MWQVTWVLDINRVIFFVPDGEPIKLPENLESLPRAEHFAAQRHRWNTNEVSDRVQTIIP